MEKSVNVLNEVVTTKECEALYGVHYATVNSRIRSYGEEGVNYRVSVNNKHDLIILKDFAEKILVPDLSSKLDNLVKVKPKQRINVEGRDYDFE